MKQRPSLLALSALLLCTAQHSSPTAPVVTGRNNVGLRLTSISSKDANHSHESRPSLKLQGAAKEPLDRLFFNTSRGNVSTVKPRRSSSWIPKAGVGNKEEVPPVCAYRVIEGGIGGQLCFRHVLSGYKCHKRDCRTVVSVGNLVANLLLNGSVLLQWAQHGESSQDDQAITAKETKAGTNMTNVGTVRPESAFEGRRRRRGGFELSCWWNGSYTQFECAGVHLGPDCKDFLLAELHENIPYRLCLRALERRRGAEHRDCVEFTLPPSGMQDIVIAMTTVGGAICVMLVIICLLVAYITENIMSPTTQHTYSYRTHSRH